MNLKGIKNKNIEPQLAIYKAWPRSVSRVREGTLRSPKKKKK